MNVVIVQDYMIKEQVLSVDTNVAIGDLLVPPITNDVDLNVIHHQEVEMTKCIIDTTGIRNDHILRSVFFFLKIYLKYQIYACLIFENQ
jgi:hypothetical protein